ncbi:luciferin 4-monooxygenase-like isoform X2 [Schistocerca piceifrons]|uniref:luciferin 4-monooxygenase-like isoform X2 n=1 Tax=Schistocerca piceifrons TaxID=274613 RepID=UPI001F5E3C1D|nr:luciferin 4-monooxygenase-like isoform X2 [Schistocerca piceifrons]
MPGSPATSNATASEDGVIRGPKRHFQLPEESLGRVLLRKMIGYGDAVAQVYPELGRLTVTYRELSQRAAGVALELKERGLKPGDVLVVATSIVPQFTPVMAGALLRGVTVAPINPGFDSNDLKTLVRDTIQPKLILAEETAASNIRSVCPDFEVVDINDVCRWLERRDVPLDSAGNVDLEEVAAPDQPDWLEHVAFIMCSSGTTGLPKGVMMTNRNILYQLISSSELELKMEPHTISLQYTALFWVSGLFVQLFSIFNGGRLIVLPRFDEDMIAKAIEEYKVVHPESGEVLGPNSEGELCFRSPMVTKGYYRRPQATAQALHADGWFHSGDIGYYDENGFFFITDRLKDLIKYRGNHVAPSELEGILLTHPAVKEAAVVGVPHQLDQERPRAYVVLQPGASVTERDLLELVNCEVADFKRLRGGVRFLNALPKTATGKVSRRDLRKLAREEAPADN